MKRTIIERKSAPTSDYTITFNGKDFKYKIQEPTFEQLSVALAESQAGVGKLNMAGGGKVVWELCCLEADEAIEKNPRILLSVCIELYTEWVLSADVEIKKN
jgi:hypothetical protein